MNQRLLVRVVQSAREVADHAAAALLEACSRAPERHVSIALSGGSTPVMLYPRIAERTRQGGCWKRLDVFFVDERSVSHEHSRSNYGLALRLLLSQVPLALSQVHPIPCETEDIDRSASTYESRIVRHVQAGARGIPCFDLIWLGVGTDGHTASLFPGTAAPSESSRLVVKRETPETGEHRITFTLPLINAARRVQFLVIGEEKAPIVRRILKATIEESGETPLPAAQVQPIDGEVEWILDREAASMI